MISTLVMASNSNIDLSITKFDSKPSLSSQSTSKGTNIIKFCRTAPEGQERDENGRKLYWCGQPECEYRSCTTTNMRLHLKQKHRIDIQSALGKAYRTKEAETELEEILKQIQSTDLSDKILQETLDQKLIEYTLLELIIVQNLSFQIVESRKFYKFYLALNCQAIQSLTISHKLLA